MRDFCFLKAGNGDVILVEKGGEFVLTGGKTVAVELEDTRGSRGAWGEGGGGRWRRGSRGGR